MADGATTVAVFRAESEARATAARLVMRGFAATMAPVIAPAAILPQVPDGRFACVAATSGKAIEFASQALLDRLRSLPFHVVGRAGRRAAESRGLTVVGEAPDVRSLARSLTSALPEGARTLYLAGVSRKPDFEASLRAAGFAVATAEVYEARGRENWSETEAKAVAAARAALHYSRRSAELATRLAHAAGFAERWRRTSHVAISLDAASPLRRAGVARVLVAEAPNEASMLEILERIFKSSQRGA